MKTPITLQKPPRERPLLVYDGSCGFCKRWVIRWQRLTRGTVDYEPYQSVSERFPEIPTVHFQRSVHFIMPDGKVYAGAEAVFRSLAYPRSGSVWLWMYLYVPLFALLAEAGYRMVAKNRHVFSVGMNLLMGKDDRPATYRISRHVFIRGMGMVYLFAFVSMLLQWEGLIGSHGIAPAAQLMEAALDQLGEEAYWRLPSVFHLSSSDSMILGVCLAGVIASLFIYAGVCPAQFLAAAWVCYLSLCNADQTFFSFQWDTLLLESGLLSIFYATVRWYPSIRHETNPPRLVRWMIYWLLFRLMFGSGYVKLASQDETWRQLTALNFHYFTQPIPTWTSWYVHHFPGWFHSASVVVMFGVELVLPFLIFLCGKGRLCAFWGMVLLQILIVLTGNYGFFNLLTIVLCLSLVEDRQWQRLIPFRFIRLRPVYKDTWLQGRGRNLWIVPICAVYGVLSGCIFLQQVNLLLIPERIVPVIETVEPFRSINRYGLFANMTTTRPEIIIEGSMDGEDWKAYPFYWKPVRLEEAPSFIGPHMPRLDWQMWFAALGRYEQNRWLIQFMAKLLQPQEEVAELLQGNPFPDAPPIYIRAVLYHYEFTDPQEKEETGQWWKREPKGLYCPVMTLRYDR